MQKQFWSDLSWYQPSNNLKQLECFLFSLSFVYSCVCVFFSRVPWYEIETTVNVLTKKRKEYKGSIRSFLLYSLSQTVLSKILGKVTINFEVIFFLSSMLFSWSKKSECSFCPEIGCDEDASYPIIKHLFIRRKDWGGGIAEGKDQMENIFSVKITDSLLEVQLIRIKFFYFVIRSPQMRYNTIHHPTRFIDSPNIGNNQIYYIG